ncbi:MAG: citrulline utilization hydrolase CtlX [Flavobacteriales bacterium]
MNTQSTGEIWMIRPTHFRMNEQTAVNNHYQKKSHQSDVEIAFAACREFDAMVEQLTHIGLIVHIHPPHECDSPDAVFPNNWISFHSGNRCVLYPMYAENRRRERLMLPSVPNHGSYHAFDLTKHETNGQFLEGTGSLVLDRIHRVAYAAISERTHPTLVKHWCAEMNYGACLFTAKQNTAQGRGAIYHTNVMMSIGTDFAAVCLACIDDLREREALYDALQSTHREIIPLSETQIDSFAGNMLELQGPHGRVIVMSSTGWGSLNLNQKKRLEYYAEICVVDIPTIEHHGGGSARCMIAEVF